MVEISLRMDLTMLCMQSHITYVAYVQTEKAAIDPVPPLKSSHQDTFIEAHGINVLDYKQIQ